jgi:hypothetical protein
MGKEKSVTTTNQTVERQPTAEETRLNQLDVALREATQGGLIGTQTAGLDIAQKLLRGENLPGYLQDLAGGISPEVTSGIVQQSLKDIMPSFQSAGIIDSGVAAEISGRTAGDIRRASEEFNIGNRLNLLNLALSGQAQIQSPVLSNAANLGQRLGTLGQITMSGSSTTMGMNPFLKSFQTSMGSNVANLGPGGAASMFTKMPGGI